MPIPVSSPQRASDQWECVQTNQHGLVQAYGPACTEFEETNVKYPGRGGSVVRSEYLIDRFRVAFESGGGWHCVCADFLKSNACAHSREAAGMRAAQAHILGHLATGRSQLGSVWSRRTTPVPDAGSGSGGVADSAGTHAAPVQSVRFRTDPLTSVV